MTANPDPDYNTRAWLVLVKPGQVEAALSYLYVTLSITRWTCSGAAGNASFLSKLLGALDQVILTVLIYTQSLSTL